MEMWQVFLYYMGMKYETLVVIHCKSTGVFEGSIALIRLCENKLFLLSLKIKTKLFL